MQDLLHAHSTVERSAHGTLVAASGSDAGVRYKATWNGKLTVVSRVQGHGTQTGTISPSLCDHGGEPRRFRVLHDAATRGHPPIETTPYPTARL